MAIYIIFYILVFLLSFRIKEKKWNIFDIILLSLIILFSGLRYGIGTDYKGYEGYYNSITSINDVLLNRTGTGYYLIAYILRVKLHLPFSFYIFLISFVTNLLVYKYFKNNSTRPAQCILMYISLGFYAFTFNAFRQSLSMIIVLYGFSFLQKNKIFQCILLYALGISFHTISLIPAAIFTILFCLKNFKINFKVVILSIIIILIFYDMFYFKILNFNSNYKLYTINSEQYIGGFGTFINAIMYLFLYLIINVLNYKKLVAYDPKNHLFSNIMSIGIIFNTISVKNWLFSRVAMSFLIFTPIILSSYYEFKEFRYKKMESLLCYIMLFIYFIVNALNFNDVVPYQSILYLNY